jgi:A/G-specific adenine glycosylase
MTIGGVTDTTAAGAIPDDAAIRRLQSLLLAWWDAGHRDLPWRRTRDPYAILVSEVMLQQTQVSRVAPKFESFMARYPDIGALASASPAEVIQAWSGLGYNRRAVNLHRMARAVVEQHGGTLPTSVAALRQLPGVGGYTARAVASIAWDEPVAAVDTNVRRVVTRMADGPRSARGPAHTQALADTLLAQDRPGDWNQALMELGALVCLPVPRCFECPLRLACRSAGSATAIREQRIAYRAAASKPAGRFEHSSRFYRGRIVDMLRAAGAGGALTADEVGARLRLDYSDADRPWLEGLLGGLARDGLITWEDGRVALPLG